MTGREGMERREMLSGMVKGMAAVVGAAIGIPALIFSAGPALERREGATWAPLGPLDGFPVGEVSKAYVRPARSDWRRAFDAEAVYVWRREPDEVVVFSRRCTDLGCPVKWDPGSAWFFCPCHGGIFSQEGEPQAGPPPRPLYRYDTRLRGGVLEVDVHSIPARA